MDVEAQCPYCGEPVTILVDPGGAAVQRYVEDCAVCCRPWEVQVVVDDEGECAVVLERHDA
jgi:transposase-like protein